MPDADALTRDLPMHRDVGSVTVAPLPVARSRPANDRRVLARTRARRWAGVLCGAGMLAAAAALSLMLGSKNIDALVVWQAVTAPAEIEDHFIVHDLRIPRTVVAVVVGLSLGIAGALIQALTRNPLADPGILGVNAGAAFAMSIGVGFFGVGSIAGYVWFAFAGALAVTFAVYAIGAAGSGGADPLRLVLAGVAIGAVLGGITSAITLLNPHAFDSMRHWGAGSVVGRELGVVWPVLPFLIVGLLLAVAAAQSLNAVALGDELASSLGANVIRTRIVVIIAVTLLAGGATAIAGPIGFVGLMVPHVARWIVGPDQRWILAYTSVIAPLLLLTADIFGRLIIRPAEVPVGIVTALVGAPVLVVLIRRRKASSL